MGDHPQTGQRGSHRLVEQQFFDEAEACERVVVLNEGKKLAEGPPVEVSSLALGRTFVAQPPEGMKARDFQARLLSEPDIVNAVPEGGLVRLVRQVKSGQSAPGMINGVEARPTPARFEDGFMVLLQKSAETKPTHTKTRQPKEPAIGSTGATRWSRFAISNGASENLWLWIM